MAAADTKIPFPAPGIAGFATKSFSGPVEPRYGEGVHTTTHETVSVGADLELPIYSPVNVSTSGVLTQAVVASGSSNANAILGAPIKMVNGQSMSVPLIREGMFDMAALNWHSTFNTDKLKREAFQGSKSPTIFIQKKNFSNDAINI